MTNCNFCEKNLKMSKYYDSYSHTECYEARDKRYIEGMCTKCGKEPIVTRKTWFCANCDQFTKYQDYSTPTHSYVPSKVVSKECNFCKMKWDERMMNTVGLDLIICIKCLDTQNGIVKCEKCDGVETTEDITVHDNTFLCVACKEKD